MYLIHFRRAPLKRTLLCCRVSRRSKSLEAALSCVAFRPHDISPRNTHKKQPLRLSSRFGMFAFLLLRNSLNLLPYRLGRGMRAESKSLLGSDAIKLKFKDQQTFARELCLGSGQTCLAFLINLDAERRNLFGGRRLKSIDGKARCM